MFVRIKKWTLATIRSVSYGVKMGDKYPRKYSLSAKSWTEVPDADANTLNEQFPGELVLSKEQAPIKTEKVVYANQPRPKGKDPQNTAHLPKPKTGKGAAAKDDDGDPDPPNDDPELNANPNGGEPE